MSEPGGKSVHGDRAILDSDRHTVNTTSLGGLIVPSAGYTDPPPRPPGPAPSLSHVIEIEDLSRSSTR